jgi:hypothetical protein
MSAEIPFKHADLFPMSWDFTPTEDLPETNLRKKILNPNSPESEALDTKCQDQSDPNNEQHRESHNSTVTDKSRTKQIAGEEESELTQGSK